MAVAASFVVTSVRVAQSNRSGRASPSGSNDQTYVARLPNSSTSARHRRALPIVASIFARLRTMPASSNRRSTLRALKRATSGCSKDSTLS